jgi:hypothetical protein
MGGFVLRSSDQPDFAIDAEQLYWLLNKEYVDDPRVDKEDINDKNKADGLSR